MHVANDKFIETVQKLFKADQGSVYLEQKRLNRTVSDDTTASPFPLIFRVSNGVGKQGKKERVSTVVEAKDIQKFWIEYADSLKKGAGGLLKKKKDKKKKTTK